MNLRKLLYAIGLPVLLFLSFVGSAQNRVISGRVTDSSGRGVPGVSVAVKGQPSVGTTTNESGNYSLSVPSNASTLTFSSVGYAYREVSINGGTANVTLQTTSADLNAVVVIGYGTVRKKDIAGAISTIGQKEFQTGSITSPEQLIVGKVAGVTITSSGGQPGAGSTIRIRGGASLNASNDPLIVVDGVPLSTGNPAVGSASNLGGINPADIESFTILKDAAAMAIYGSRASNGVILITTKHGRSGKPVFSFTTQVSASTLPKEYPVLSADQFKTLVNSIGTSTQKSLLGSANTDWQKQIYQTGITSDNNLSVSGSWKNMPYRIGAEYLDETGILKTGRLQREELSVSLTPHLLNDHLKIDINVHGSNTDSRVANTNAIGNAVAFDPTQPVYSGKKPFGGYYEWTTGSDSVPNSLSNRNPLALLEQQDAENNALRSFGNVQFDYKFPFLPDLHANLNLGYDVANYTGTTKVPAYSAQSYNAVPTLRGQNNQYQNNYFNRVGEFYFNYLKDISSIKSNINAVAGYGYYDDHYFNKNFYSFSAYNDTMPGSAPNYPNGYSEVTLISYYGRLIYTFNNKYVLMGSYRTDGSSRFGSGYNWGVFPAGAFTWRINQENFLKESKAISDLKLRVSYGLTGNQNGISFYNYLNYLALSSNTSRINFGNTYYNFWSPSPFAKDLQWEETATTDVGFDYGFFNNRITGSIDYYYKKTKELLASVYVPTLTNFGNLLTRNVGNMTDEGVDFNINATLVRSKNLRWDIGFNASYNKFTITNLTVSQDSLAKLVNDPVGGISGGTGNTIQTLSIGYSPNAFYVLQQVYDAKGKPIEGLYVDQNRDGIINQQDLVQYKSPFAPFTFGFTTSLAYKRWSFSTVLRASVGNYMYNNVASNLAVTRNVLNPVGFLQNAPSSILNTNFANNQFFSSYYVENASYLKMDNIGITYSFGKLSNRISNLNLSLNCQNVFTVTKYTGLDPEIFSGIDNTIYPRPRIFTLGANVNF